MVGCIAIHQAAPQSPSKAFADMTRALIVCLIILGAVSSYTLVAYAEESSFDAPVLAVMVVQESEDSPARTFFPAWQWLENSGIDSEFILDELLLAVITLLGFGLTIVGLLRGR